MFNVTRRLFLAASATASLFPSSILARARKPAAGQRLRYARPAARWEEALPMGNGRLGAMLFGRVAQERLQLNEQTLWAGSPYTPDNPEALAAIPRVRKLLEAQQYTEATELVNAKVMAKPLRQMPYGSLGDVFLNFPDAQIPTRYVRSLDLETAIVTTAYRTKSGAFTREAFASSPHQVIVLNLGSPRRKLSFDLGYRAPREVTYTSPSYQGSATTLSTNEPIDWLVTELADARASNVHVSSDGPDCLLITGRNIAASGIPGGLEFALRIKIASDGRLVSQDGRIAVHDARNALLLICAATSYVSYEDVSADPVAIVRRSTDSAARASYETLRREHIREYQSLYSTASLDLPAT